VPGLHNNIRVYGGGGGGGGSTVSTLGNPVSLPVGDPNTITDSLGPYPNQKTRDVIFAAATNGRIPDYFKKNPGDCGATTVSGLSLSQLGIQAGQSGAALGVGALQVAGTIGGVAAGAATAGIGLVTTVLLGLITHHKQAVALEQADLCQAVPDANNFLIGVDQAVAAGRLDFNSAPSILDQGLTAWRQEVGAILKDTGGKCNAACVYEKCFQACIAIRKLKYQYQAASSAQSANLPGSVVSAAPVAAPIVVPTGISAAPLAVAPAVGNLLAQAGFTPQSQSTLATVVIVGVAILLGAVAVKFIFGGGKTA
jgi:hypothetical protein